MAAPTTVVLRQCRKAFLQHKFATGSSVISGRSASGWSKFFKGSRDEDVEPERSEQRRLTKFDGPTTAYNLSSLKKRESISCVRGYTPPPDVGERILSIAASISGQEVTEDFKLHDRLVKFQLLTNLMKEFDHVIPNTTLSELDCLGDVVSFFSTPVKDKSVYEDLTTLDLPRNLHIQLEPVRFDPETDTFFDGKTAFPGRPTVVTSLKYRRKYKGTSGESRNQRSKTNYEMEKELDEERERAGVNYFPSEGINPVQPNYKKKQEQEVPLI